MPLGGRDQVRPLPGADALAQKRLVIAKRCEVVAVAVAPTHVGLVGAAAAIGVSAVLVDVAEERDAPPTLREVVAFAAARGVDPGARGLDGRRRVQPRCAAAQRLAQLDGDPGALSTRAEDGAALERQRDEATTATPPACVLSHARARREALCVEVLAIERV